MEIKQHSSVLHQPTKWLRELILEQTVHYMSNRMLEINFQNARCTEDTNRNKYVNKKNVKGKSRYGGKSYKRYEFAAAVCNVWVRLTLLYK